MATTEKTTGARTGEQFLEGLRSDEREIWLEGEKITDPSSHPKLQGAAAEPGRISSICSTPTRTRSSWTRRTPASRSASPTSGRRTKDDLERRRKASKAIADASVGMMGRTPDYLNYTFACFAARADVWAPLRQRAGRREPRPRTRTSCATTTCRSRTRSSTRRSTARSPRPTRPGGEVSLHKVEDTENGILVRGARMLATLAPFADELAVYPGARPAPAGRQVRDLLLDPDVDARPQVRLPRLVLVEPRPVGLPALDPLRRDGRGRDLRRRRDPPRPDLPGRRRAAPHGGHHRLALARAHHPPGHDPRLGEARVRLRARPHDGRRSRASRSSTTCRRSSARSGR